MKLFIIVALFFFPHRVIRVMVMRTFFSQIMWSLSLAKHDQKA